MSKFQVISCSESHLYLLFKFELRYNNKYVERFFNALYYPSKGCQIPWIAAAAWGNLLGLRNVRSSGGDSSRPIHPETTSNSIYRRTNENTNKIHIQCQLWHTYSDFMNDETQLKGYIISFDQGVNQLTNNWWIRNSFRLVLISIRCWISYKEIVGCVMHTFCKLGNSLTVSASPVKWRMKCRSRTRSEGNAEN